MAGVYTEETLQSLVSAEFLHHIGVNISGDKIEACHRLGKNSDRTIVEFSSRKDCDDTVLLWWYHKLTSTFQQEQSCLLMTACVLIVEDYGMKPRNCGTRKKILSYFTVRIRLQEKGPYGIITHIDDLKELFPDEDFLMFWLDRIVSCVCTL